MSATVFLAAGMYGNGPRFSCLPLVGGIFSGTLIWPLERSGVRENDAMRSTQTSARFQIFDSSAGQEEQVFGEAFTCHLESLVQAINE